MLKVTFPDGAQKEYDKGITPLEIAQSISHSLAKRLLSASFNNKQITIKLSQKFKEYVKRVV